MNPFTLAAINFAWLPLLPLITVALGAMVIMLVGPSVEDDDSAGLGLIALITVLAAFVLTLFTLGQNTLAFGGALANDNYAGFFEIVILAATGVTIGMSLDYVADQGLAGASSITVTDAPPADRTRWMSSLLAGSRLSSGIFW